MQSPILQAVRRTRGRQKLGRHQVQHGRVPCRRHGCGEHGVGGRDDLWPVCVSKGVEKGLEVRLEGDGEAWLELVHAHTGSQ